MGKNFDDGNKSKHLTIISGLSGSGKSVALRALEDLDYYCIDNLPIFLLRQFVEKVIQSDDSSLQRVAVSIDSRNSEHLESIGDELAYMRDIGIAFEIVFLDAEQNELVKRFSETRRKHPLMDNSGSLVDSVRLEKQLLASISERASKHIDTTNVSAQELRVLMQEDAADPTIAELTVLIRSFAYKRGTPLDADFVFDVRCLPNPYWVEGLKDCSGLDEPVHEYFSDKHVVEDMIEDIDQFIGRWVPRFHDTGRLYLNIAIGCTGGRHRSVYVVEKLTERCRHRGIKIQKRHTEIG